MKKKYLMIGQKSILLNLKINRDKNGKTDGKHLAVLR